LTVGGVVVISDQAARSTANSAETSLAEEEARVEVLPPSEEKALSRPVLFPNPAQGTVTLRTPDTGTWTARLYNTLGQLVATHTFEGTETVLALPPQKGLYWVVIEGAGQTYRLPLVRE